MSTYVLVRSLERSLARSMRTRANGSLHIRGCYNVSVNSRMYLCSDACVEAQQTLETARTWMSNNAPTVPKLRIPTL